MRSLKWGGNEVSTEAQSLTFKLAQPGPPLVGFKLIPSSSRFIELRRNQADWNHEEEGDRAGGGGVDRLWSANNDRCPAIGCRRLDRWWNPTRNEIKINEQSQENDCVMIASFHYCHPSSTGHSASIFSLNHCQLNHFCISLVANSKKSKQKCQLIKYCRYIVACNDFFQAIDFFYFHQFTDFFVIFQKFTSDDIFFYATWSVTGQMYFASIELI